MDRPESGQFVLYISVVIMVFIIISWVGEWDFHVKVKYPQ